MTGSPRLRIAGISGSPSPVSKSRVLVETALGAFGDGAETTLIDLAALPADALLGRGSAAEGGGGSAGGGAGPCAGGRPRMATAVREPRRDGDRGGRIRDARSISRRRAGNGAAPGGG